MEIFVCYWVENTVGKGETDSYRYFLLFQRCLQKALLNKRS